MRKKALWIFGIALLIIILIIVCVCIKINKLDKTEDTIPYMPDDDCIILEEDVKKGMTVKDKFENEWVWIVVPKTIVFKNARNNTDYENIKNDINEYIKEYSEDKYYDVDINENVLSNIYDYGGFWISRYEIGAEQIRGTENNIRQNPLSQPDKYVYNYVTYNEAKEIAKLISNSSYNSNLLYGFQWDLICKFIEENGYNYEGNKITKEMINGNSSSWGNYYSSTFNINRGQYSTNYGKDYEKVKNETTKRAYKHYLFTTGASEQNKTCNIYDFAGNVSEWTLESSEENKNMNVIRDGSFYFNYGGNDPVNGRYVVSPEASSNSYGFRITLTK